MHWSRGWSSTDHVADNSLITWLIMHYSRDWSWTDHVTAEIYFIFSVFSVSALFQFLSSWLCCNSPEWFPCLWSRISIILRTLRFLIICLDSFHSISSHICSSISHPVLQTMRFLKLCLCSSLLTQTLNLSSKESCLPPWGPVSSLNLTPSSSTWSRWHGA